MSTDYDENVEKEIPGEVYVFAVIDDEENESMPDIISHVDDYELPENFVRERKVGGGVCTYALLRALESMKGEDGSRKKKLTWADALEFMHNELEEEGGRQSLPTLSTSRAINIHEERLRIISTSKRGTKRALLVGAHYEDEEDENVWLASCHTDVRRMRNHLIHEEGFEKRNVFVIMDDDRHHEPTKGIILDSLERMCQISEPGDSIFFHFSGHGGTLMNQDEYDEDGIMHELLAPGDFRESGVGVLMDDELYSSFVTKVPEGVHAVVVIDTCHPVPFRSGKSSAIDLPYVCAAGDEELRYSEGFRPGRMLMASAAGAAGIAAGAAALTKSKKKKKEKKKKKPEAEEDEEGETFDIDFESSEVSDEGKSKKKSKHKKKKKKQETEDHSGEGLEEEKPKKKKKKPKKK